MGTTGNGIPPASLNGRPADPATATKRCPRRLVLLSSDEGSAVERVLREYQGPEISGNRLHADVQQFAGDHPGRCVAAEWLGSLGWTRFLWCRK
jgi:hypothetical protein